MNVWKKSEGQRLEEDNERNEREERKGEDKRGRYGTIIDPEINHND